MFLSEWCEFLSTSCLAEKRNLMTAHVSMLLKSCAHRLTCFLSASLTRKDLTIQNYQRDALNIIYSSNIITLLYMFRVSSTHPQEDIVVHKQHMVPSLSIRVLVSC